MQEGRLVSHGRARALQAGPVQARPAARRAAEGLPAPAADLAADPSLAAGDAAQLLAWLKLSDALGIDRSIDRKR